MNIAKHIDELASALGRPIPAPSRDELSRFAELVRTWNARLDLTAARDNTSLVEVLFADAIILSDHQLVPEKASLLDVGSGAGAPALPFSILREDVNVTMLEPLRKRIAFLRTAIGTLHLEKRVRAIEGRLERVPSAQYEPMDIASARATFPPEEWLSLGLRLAPACLVFTASEPPSAPSGARIAHRAQYVLPYSRAPRVLTRYERT
jgi:16S rRNA (guanine527-N7)-methyltransferase